ncbi:MAG: hypothetical protein HONBIEJF_01553 [Fimbriimonadaceae bacterium]|nr:hypothetical protein [Fimbriimonadaceae bacterium]
MRHNRSTISIIAGIVVVGFAAFVQFNWKSARRVGFETAVGFLDLAKAGDFEKMTSARVASETVIQWVKESEAAHGKILRYRIVAFGCQIGGTPWSGHAIVWREKGAFSEGFGGSRRFVSTYGLVSATPLSETQIREEFQRAGLDRGDRQ